MLRPRVLVLCYGNVNRSPLAAAVLAEQGCPVRSAGFYKAGPPAAKKTRHYAAQLGYDLSTHRAQLATQEMVEWAQLIICMGENVRRRLQDKFAVDSDKVTVWHISDPGFISGDSPKFLEIQDAVVAAAKELRKQWRPRTSRKQ